MSQYKHILFATDLDDDAFEVANKVKALAELFSAKLSAVHCIEPLPVYGNPLMDDLDKIRREHAIERFSKLKQLLNISDDNKEQVLEGPTKTKITETATKLGADLIVIGRHSRHGLARLLGSTATAVLNHSDCDVLVIRI